MSEGFGPIYARARIVCFILLIYPEPKFYNIKPLPFKIKIIQLHLKSFCKTIYTLLILKIQKHKSF